MTSTTCPICGEPAEELPTPGDLRDINSPSTGGRYAISGTAKAILADRPLDERGKTRLTAWIKGQRQDGEECPLVTSWVLETVVGRGG